MEKDYNMGVKARARKKWEKFLRRTFDDFKKLRVLFLPGEQALEVAVYDRLGIPRRNLLGLESDTNIHKVLLKKANEMGFQMLPCMTFAEFAKRYNDDSCKETFDIISLDFQGGPLITMGTCNNLYLMTNKKSAVFVNFYSQRQRGLQAALLEAAEKKDAYYTIEAVHKFIGESFKASVLICGTLCLCDNRVCGARSVEIGGFQINSSNSLWLQSQIQERIHKLLFRQIDEAPKFNSWGPEVHKLIPEYLGAALWIGISRQNTITRAEHFTYTTPSVMNVDMFETRQTMYLDTNPLLALLGEHFELNIEKAFNPIIALTPKEISNLAIKCWLFVKRINQHNVFGDDIKIVRTHLGSETEHKQQFQEVTVAKLNKKDLSISEKLGELIKKDPSLVRLHEEDPIKANKHIANLFGIRGKSKVRKIGAAWAWVTMHHNGHNGNGKPHDEKSITYYVCANGVVYYSAEEIPPGQKFHVLDHWPNATEYATLIRQMASNAAIATSVA